MTKIARPGSEGNMRLLKQYGGGSTPPRQHFATGGAVRSGGNPALDEGLSASGEAARPNLSRPGRKAKKDKDKAKTNINIVVMGKDKDAAPPATPPGPMAAGPMPPPPMPMPPKPPMGGPEMGPPMPMRASGGRVNRADGGEVEADDQAEYKVAGGFGGLAKAAGSAAKASSGVAKGAGAAAGKGTSSGVGSAVMEGVRQGEAAMNGTPGAPIGTVRRGVLDALSIPGRRGREEERKKQKEMDKTTPPVKFSTGGPAKPPVGIDDGAGGGKGRLEKIKSYGK